MEVMVYGGRFTEMKILNKENVTGCIKKIGLLKNTLFDKTDFWNTQINSQKLKQMPQT